MKKMFVLMLLITVTLVASAQAVETPKLGVWDFIRNHDWLNVALVAAFSIGGIARYAFVLRSKLKEVAELLLMVYEFTGDKVLDKEEQAKIWDKILQIAGKKQVEAMAPAAKEKAAELKHEVVISKTKSKIKTKVKNSKS